MAHTLEEFNQFALPLAALGSPKLKKLCEVYTAYLGRAAQGDSDADLCCSGIVVALAGLHKNHTKDSERVARLLWLLENLTEVKWFVPKKAEVINFFYVAGGFQGRPNGVDEVFAILNKLETCTAYVNGGEGMASVLCSITTFVFWNISECAPVILKRYENMIDALALCSARVKGSFLLTATGSDTHCGGHQAVFLSSSTAKLVYKPRSLDADIAFFRLIDYFNSLVAKNARGFPLPTLAIQNAGDNWGTEYFAKHVGALHTQDAVRKYYFQMGELTVLASLFGMGDLHQDNLIPTADGPVIIDAECCLQPDVLGSQQLGSTQIFETLKRCETADPAKIASSVFQIGTDCSSKVYRQYTDQIVEGFLCARQLLGSDPAAVLETLMELRTATKQIRIVPLSTDGFAKLDPEDDEKKMANKLEWQTMLNRLTTVLGGKRFHEAELYTRVVNALTCCDIPYFCFVLIENVACLMCDGQELSATDFYSTDNIRAVLTANFAWLMSDAATKQLYEELKK